jgi:hypothetical protein
MRCDGVKPEEPAPEKAQNPGIPARNIVKS